MAVPGQLFLDEDFRPEVRNGHLFLAIIPDAAELTASVLVGRQLSSKHRLRGRPIAADRLHLTLCSFGMHDDVPETWVQAIKLASESVAASLSAFEVRFSRACSFSGTPGNLPLVLRDDGLNAALMGFHGRLSAALEECGFRWHGKPRFTPHVTLGYHEQRIAEEPIETVVWTVNEFVLLHRPQPRASYVRVARWMFLGSPEDSPDLPA